jgi:hypothetical protein
VARNYVARKREMQLNSSNQSAQMQTQGVLMDNDDDDDDDEGDDGNHRMVNGVRKDSW